LKIGLFIKKLKVLKNALGHSLNTSSKMKCSLCKKEGHRSNNKKFHPKVEMETSNVEQSPSYEMDPNVDILSCESWKNTAAFKEIEEKETQIKFYKANNASAEVNQLVHLDSKPFGSAGEKMLAEIFGMGARTSTQNDGMLNGKKVEFKCARFWAGKDDCKWQHLEPDHDYEYALFALLDFHGWKVWCIKKSMLMGELREKKIVTFQGKQGWWTNKSAILPHLTHIKTRADLNGFIQ